MVSESEEDSKKQWALNTKNILWTTNFDSTQFSQALYQGRLKYDSIDAAQFADYLIAAGTRRVAAPRALQCLQMVLFCENFTLPDLLDKLTQFEKFEYEQAIASIFAVFRNNLGNFRCDPQDKEACLRFADSVLNFFGWAAKGIEYCVREELEDSLDIFVVELSSYIRENIIYSLLQYCWDQPEKVALVMGPINAALEHSPEQANLKQLHLELTNTFKESPYIPDHDLDNPMNQSPAAIRTLASIFASFRVTATVGEIVQTLQMIASTLKTESKTMIKEFIYTCLLKHLDPTKSIFVDSFFLLKLPRILAMIRNDISWPIESMEAILQEVLIEGKHILDAYQDELPLQVFLFMLTETGVISKAFSDHVAKARSPHHQKDHKNHLIWKAIEARNTITKMWNSQKFLEILSHMVNNGGVSFDTVCTTFCASDNMLNFSSKIARANLGSEKPTPGADPEERAKTFDLTFHLLYRMRQTFNNLTTEEIVSGGSEMLEEGIFYKWDIQCVRRLGQRPVIEKSSAEEMEKHRDKVMMLRESGRFWDPATAAYGDVINMIPVICDIIITQYSETNAKQFEAEYRQIITNIFNASSFLMICIIHWLDMQPDSEAKMVMARTLHDCMNELIQTDANPMPLFVRNSCQHQIDEMLSGPAFIESMAYTVIAMSDRKLTPLRSKEVPERHSLKCAWFYIQKQAWVSPPALKLLDHCNREGVQKLWIEVFMHNSLRNRTADELLCAGELMLSAALLDPARSLVSLTQCVVDYLVPEEEENATKIFYECPHALPMARLLANLLIVAEWVISEGRRRANDTQTGEPEPKRRREGNSSYFPESERKVIQELAENVEIAIVKLSRVSEGLLTPVVTFISHLLVQIANQRPGEKEPAYEAWLALARKIPIGMLKNLVVLEPYAVTLQLFEVFLKLHDPSRSVERLQFIFLAQQ
ncbi:unnamed protein product, partial [Mesorhabditis spiculigera]